MEAVLTGAGSVVFCVLLWVASEPALETVLPELSEPGVALICVWLQVQVIIIEPGDVSGL